MHIKLVMISRKPIGVQCFCLYYEINGQTTVNNNLLKMGNGFYASPSSGQAYSDRQLITNLSFELNFFFVCHMMFPYEDSKTVSVCLSVHREYKSPWLRQYRSYISNWYINGKSLHEYYSMETQKFDFF